MNKLFFKETKYNEDIFANVDKNFWGNLFEEKIGYEEIRFEEAPVTEKTPQLASDKVQVEDDIVRNYSTELMLADRVQKGEVSHDIAIKLCKTRHHETGIYTYAVGMSLEK